MKNEMRKEINLSFWVHLVKEITVFVNFSEMNSIPN